MDYEYPDRFKRYPWSRKPNTAQTKHDNITDDTMLKQLDIIESKINRLAEDMALLLEERTRPAVPKKYPTEETVEIDIYPELTKDLAEVLKPRRTPTDFVASRIEQMGGKTMFARKYSAGLASAMSTTKPRKTRGNYYGYLLLIDYTLPRTKSGQPKRFEINCNDQAEYDAAVAYVSNIINAPLKAIRSRK